MYEVCKSLGRNVMSHYIWLFPTLFMFHDMEEIMGFGVWYKKNKAMLDTKYPKISKTYENCSTEGMAFAVFEELLLCIAICIISICFEWYPLWLGGFIAYTVHLVIHIMQSIVIRKYIPAVATSMIALPFSLYIINNSIDVLQYSSGKVVMVSIVGIMVIVINLKFAHYLMHKFTLWINKKLS